MLGLPKSTEITKQLPKKAIYTKFNMNTPAKDKFDSEISKIVIVNEISPTTTTLEKGNEVSSLFVLLVSLKKKEFTVNIIAQLSKLIPQNILFILEFDGNCKLAVYRTKLIQSEWISSDKCTIQLNDLNIDTVWENIIVQIGGIQIESGNTLDEQIAVDEQRQKLQKEIDRLEKQARAESQPKKKFELVQEINRLRNDNERVF